MGKPMAAQARERRLPRAWPVDRPRQWVSQVNKPQAEQELEAIRHSLKRGTPYGSEDWVSQSAVRLQLTHTLRPRGRPRNGGAPPSSPPFFSKKEKTLLED